MKEIRCFVCRKKLMELDGKAEVICPKCKTLNKVSTKEVQETQSNK